MFKQFNFYVGIFFIIMFPNIQWSGNENKTIIKNTMSEKVDIHTCKTII